MIARAIVLALLTAATASAAPPQIEPSPRLGTEAAKCRTPEAGPAFEIAIEGLKDRKGVLRIELYPDNDTDFLADDNVLVQAGKAFRRLDAPVPPQGPVLLCLRAPTPGRYSLAILHDRNDDRKFTLFSDGVGFPGNPRLGMSKPPAAAAAAEAGPGLTRIRIRMNYLRGFGLRPLSRTQEN